MVTAFGSTLAVARSLVSYGPDNALINLSDYCSVSVTSARVRFSRPTVDGQGYETCNPGARIRIRTDSAVVKFRLRYTNLVTRLDTYNAYGVILADGASQGNFTRELGPDGAYVVAAAFSSATMRTIEVVLPYCASVDFEGFDLTPEATLQAPAARPVTRYVAMGDSITHGFLASRVDNSWPYLLALSKGWQYVNHGYGGRRVTPADGTTLASLNPTVATYLIGYNDFVGQVPLASFKIEYLAFLDNFRAVNTTTKLYCLTPTYSPNTNPLTLENYRQQIRDSLTARGNALNVLVEGVPLATNDLAHFPDTVHPSDSAAVQISTALAAVVTP